MHAVREVPPSGVMTFALEQPPAPDSATVGLWRLDEAAGVQIADSGPRHLDGFVGRDARPEYARFGGGRRFGFSLHSYATVPYSTAIETGTQFSLEAWVQPTSYSPFESSAIAARWSREANQQSWYLGLVGDQSGGVRLGRVSPGTFADLTGAAGVGVLLFGLQPAAAGQARAFTSTGPLPLDRWTHVAVSFDGALVRIYLDGRLDAQYAFAGRIRASEAPLLIGNVLDTSWFVYNQTSVRLEPVVDAYPYYAFVGVIDEVRLSNVARFAPGRGR
jgi:hypothetical protein